MQSIVEEDYAAQTTIFEEGAVSDSLFIILEGVILFTKQSSNEKEDRMVGMAREGSFFGEIGLFTDEPRLLSAKSQTPAKLARISREALYKFIKAGGTLKEKLLGSVIENFPTTIHHYTKKLQEQRAVAKIGSILHTVIHDFKNPLATIKLGIQLLAREYDDEKTVRICRNIEEQAQHLVDMLDEVREFSRGRKDLQLSTFSLKQLIDRFKELNYPLVEEKTIDFKFDVEDIEVEADGTKLLRLLQNLILNARESLSGKEGKICVTARADDASQTFCISIEDNGSGIPQAIRKKLFDPFVTSGKSHGTGLGLAIVKAIVDAHQGRIQFQTHRNKGTRFDVVFPLRQSAPSSEQASLPLRT